MGRFRGGGSALVLAAALSLHACSSAPSPETGPKEIPAEEAGFQGSPPGAPVEQASPGHTPPEQAPPGQASPSPGVSPPEPFPDSSPSPNLTAPPTEPLLPASIRVGLETDLPDIVLPCCGTPLKVDLGGEELTLVAPVRITPGASVVGGSRFRLQVAALKDEVQALELAGTWSRRLGHPADARFDAGTDLYRVRVGAWVTREEAERARGGLEAQGLGDAWIAQEGTDLRSPSLQVIQGDRTYGIAGRWLRVEASAEGGVPWKGVRYRGVLAVYLNDRGRLNLVNELTLEDYLRGVVPMEMGPFVYPELEALKAQAVAARSYTLRHLGEFVREGYDICATPRCHVYGGMDAEQPLTNQALKETSGEVLAYGGKTADTLYTATCGGRTENVEVVFPGLPPQPYLRGVPCMEGGVTALSGSLRRGVPLDVGVAEVLLPVQPDLGAVQGLEERLRRLAGLAGLPLPSDHLSSLDRREVQRFVASLFDLALDASLFVAPEDLVYLVERPPPGWNEEALRQGALLLKSGLFTASLDSPLEGREVDHLLVQLARLLRVVDVEEVRFLQMAEPDEVRRLVVRTISGEISEVPLPDSLPTFRRLSGTTPSGKESGTESWTESTGEARSGSLTLVAGDRLDLYRSGDQLLALVQEVNAEGVSFDRTSKRVSWTRFRTDRELAERVHRRYPGLGFRSFEILERGPSGRVSKIRLRGADSRSVEVAGLAVRWTLDVPETFFTATRVAPKDGRSGWLFRGRGWGHGIGMCQEGAFGMAQRGHGYREILGHYYSGAQLQRLEVAAGQ